MGNDEVMQAPSSRRETRSGNLAAPRKRSIGCMSGILHFLSRHSHKRLASGPKKEKTVKTVASPSIPPTSSEKRLLLSEAIQGKQSTDPYLAVKAPRSPAIPLELRRPSRAASPGSPRPPPAVVARLMGLEDGPQLPPPPPESTAEKRRRLLGALERCDEDLKELRRIIESLRSADTRIQAPEAVRSEGPAKGRGAEADGRRLAMGGEQPSPNSVLDPISSPRFRFKGFEPEDRGGSVITVVGSRMVKPYCTRAFFLGGNCKKAYEVNESHAFQGKATIERLPMVWGWMEKRAYEEFKVKRRWPESGGCPWLPLRRTRALVESMEEVWENGEWGERQEWARVVVGVEGDIWKDLVEEVVVKLFSCYCKLFLPLRTCRKRLYF